MPANNRKKNYIKGAYYHIYNRGVNRQEIFYEDHNYLRFLNKLQEYSLDKNLNPRSHIQNVTILSYCLMPNHFHLLVQNLTCRGIEKFMKSICVSHSMYINKKYGRVGHLFQDNYKAKIIKTDEQLIATSRYIHLNPKNEPLEKLSYPYSSAQYYVSGEGPFWLEISTILNYFSLEQEKASILYTEYLERTQSPMVF